MELPTFDSLDSFHILLGLGALVGLYFIIPPLQKAISDQTDHNEYLKRDEENYEYDRELPYGMEHQSEIEQVDPSDYTVLPAIPTVRRGHYYGTDYMLTKIQKNKQLAEPTPDIHFIEPDAYRKSNIMELRDLDYIYDPEYPI